MEKPGAVSLSKEMRLLGRGNKQPSCAKASEGKRMNGLNIIKNIIIAGVLLCGVFLGVISATTPEEKKPIQSKDTIYTFQKDILPLLQTNCKPCHFPGGTKYQKLPFDDSSTVFNLGKKLNSRLKEKEQQKIINSWVESGTKEK